MSRYMHLLSRITEGFVQQTFMNRAALVFFAIVFAFIVTGMLMENCIANGGLVR